MSQEVPGCVLGVRHHATGSGSTAVSRGWCGGLEWLLAGMSLGAPVSTPTGNNAGGPATTGDGFPRAVSS